MPYKMCIRDSSVDEVSFGNELRDILNGVQPGRTAEEAPLPRHISFALEGETEEEKLSSRRELVVNWPPLRNMESLRDTHGVSIFSL